MDSKEEMKAYHRAYYASPENKDYFRDYAKSRRQEKRVYAKERRAAIKAGTWVFKETKENTKHKNLAHREKIRQGWAAYFDMKRG